MSQLIEKKEREVKEVKESCPICCGNKSKIVRCMYCNFTACSDCCQKYLLEHITPKCMSCSKVWSFEFIQTSFSFSFLNGKYKHHRENILFNKEQSLMPNTQIVLEKKNMEKKIQEKLKQLKEKEEELMDKLRILNRTQRNVYTGNKEKIIKCIATDCRGFLKSNGKQLLECGVCSVKCCKECREERKNHDDEHKCNPETVETIKMIEKECKPCPKCSSMILKIEGCDQMWCTQCQTAFSWKTGQIETGHIHNPHYWEYLRRQGKEDAEVNRVYGNRIGGERRNEEITVCNYNMHDIFHGREYRANIDCIGRFFIEFCRIESHLRIVILPDIQVNVNEPKLNEDLRLRYLNNEMDEKYFKQMLQRRNKLHEFKNEKYMILSTYSTVFREIVIKYLEVLRVRFEKFQHVYIQLKDMVDEFENLVDFTKDSYSKLCDRFNYKDSNNELDQSIACILKIKATLVEISKDEKSMNKKMMY